MEHHCAKHLPLVHRVPEPSTSSATGCWEHSLRAATGSIYVAAVRVAATLAHSVSFAVAVALSLALADALTAQADVPLASARITPAARGCHSALDWQEVGPLG